MPPLAALAMIAMALALAAGVATGWATGSVWAGVAVGCGLACVVVLVVTSVNVHEQAEDRRHSMQLEEFLRRLEHQLREDAER